MKKLFRVTANSKEEITEQLLKSLELPNLEPSLTAGLFQASFLYENTEDRLIKTREKIKELPNKIDKKKVCFLFTGQGSQYPGMARTLYESLPLVNETIHEYIKHLATLNDNDYLSGLIGENEIIHQTEFTQPSIVMLQLALSKIWTESQVSASYYIGHSVGEFSACAANQSYDEHTLLSLISKRAQLMQSTPVDGGMIAIAAGEDDAQSLMKTHHIDLDFAAYNAPKQTVLSGSKSEINRMSLVCSNAGVRAKVLTVSHPFHSRLMEPILDEFYNDCQKNNHRDIKNQQNNGKIIGNVTGEKLLAPQDPDYWCKHIVRPVKFKQSIQTAYDSGCRIFLEIGPDATLTQLTKKILADKDDIVAVYSMKRGRCAKASMVNSAVTLEKAGIAIDWQVLSSLLNTIDA